MRRPSQDLNPAYGYLWWLNGQDKYLVPGLPFPFNGAISPSAPSDLYAGLGKDGQFLDIVPSQDLVVIRMGENPDNSLVPILFHDEMWEHINKVICLPTSSKEVHSETFKIYPNPGQNHINIPNLKANAPIWLISSSGQIMGINSKNGNIDISVLKCGTYFIKYLDKKGYYQYQVFVKTK
jgi:hypothetical protein